MQAIIVNGTTEEIAALAKEMQERQKKPFVPETADGSCEIGTMVKSGQSIL